MANGKNRSDGKNYEYDTIELPAALSIAVLLLEIEISESSVRAWQNDCRQSLELIKKLRDSLTDKPNGSALDYVNRARC